MAVFSDRLHTHSLLRHLMAIAASGLLFTLVGAFVNARDLGQWNEQDALTSKWFRSLTTPDYPMVSCCETSDGYWADEFEEKDGQYVAIVTDTRPDHPLQRQHIEYGTRFVIPYNRVVRRADNPTGHGWIFVISDVVYCYLPPAGV